MCSRWVGKGYENGRVKGKSAGTCLSSAGFDLGHRRAGETHGCANLTDISGGEGRSGALLGPLVVSVESCSTLKFLCGSGAPSLGTCYAWFSCLFFFSFPCLSLVPSESLANVLGQGCVFSHLGLNLGGAGVGWRFVYTSAVLLPFVCLNLFYSQPNLLPPPCCYFPLYWLPFPPNPSSMTLHFPLSLFFISPLRSWNSSGKMKHSILFSISS